MHSDFYTVKRLKRRNEKHLSLKGDWTVENLSDIHKTLKKENFQNYKKVILNAADLGKLDTAASVYLLQLEDKTGLDFSFKGFSKKHRDMLALVSENYVVPKDQSEKKTFGLPEFLVMMGRKALAFKDLSAYVLAIFGQFVYNIIQIGAGRQNMRPRSIVYHINEIGIRALPVIFLMAFAISLVMGYQGATQLENFGASIYTIDLVAISVLREMGVLLTAIMVAGRTGSAFAAQIGTMKLNEEIDALQTMGVSPFNALILPRLAGILIALPILTFLANIVAFIGLYIYCHTALDITYSQFVNRLEDVITPAHFWTGMVKAPVFALIIGAIGCMQGMQVRHSAEDVGKHTTHAVVQSIFMVILMDAVFSIIFTNLGV